MNELYSAISLTMLEGFRLARYSHQPRSGILADLPQESLQSCKRNLQCAEVHAGIYGS